VSKFGGACGRQRAAQLFYESGMNWREGEEDGKKKLASSE
jgi:hypothetical protein